jgi:ABC-type phosphate/phosphonate transport system substrate-binding protein
VCSSDLSFVAAVFVGKGVARPVARPLRAGGGSTYSTLVVARAGTRPFAGIADLAGKRVAYCRLASAGEIYLRSLVGPGARLEGACTPVPCDTHQAALEAITGGTADYAIVKNTAFSSSQYPGLAVVGADGRQHPDNTFIMPKDAYEKVGALISRVLLGLADDTGEKAAAVKQAFGCTGFIATAGADFAPTFSLLKPAGVDLKTFAFTF